jgi:hypothetical protein
MFNVTNTLNFGCGEKSTSESNICFASSKEILCKYDWLIFVDSRGLESDSSLETTWLYQVCDKLGKKNSSYLAISRPKNITTFATLINFINLNDIHFSRLITNLGFVDCTPKKEIFVKDIEEQVKEFFYEKLESHTFPEYLTSEKELVNLYSLQYSKNYLAAVTTHLKLSFIESYFITTPIIDSSITFKRERPYCFYEQLKVTNSLIHTISLMANAKIVELETLSLSTFDGVHFNEFDHAKLGEYIIKRVL